MSSESASPLEAALQEVPAALRRRLLKEYEGLKAALASGQHDSCGVRAGKFSEVCLRVLQHRLTGSSVPLGKSIGDFTQEVRKLENASGPDGLRIIAGRGLAFIYTLRNKRDFGHVGDDIDANEIDTTTAARVADWCLIELIRDAHSIPIEEAQEIVNALTERKLPKVWSVAGKKRVLATNLSYSERVLLLLYSDPALAVPFEDLLAWTEHSNATVFRRDVVRALHSRRLAEYDRDSETVLISPSGVRFVEDVVLPKLDE